MRIDLYTISSRSAVIFHALRWNGCVCCPECGSVHIYNSDPGRLHICGDCGARFSDTSGTIFHSTKLGLDKWLYAIYLFLTSTRGISSYALARYIGVSQTTAWTMLMKLRSCLSRDIRFESTDQVAIDEIYLGANWNRIPAYKKYSKAGSPPEYYNLNDKDRKAWYKKRFYELASEDKMPVLGFVALDSPKLVMIDIDTPDRKEFVMDQIKYRFGDVMCTMFVDSPMTVVTDQSQLYKFLTEIKDHNNRPKFRHEVCRHDLNKYASSNGVSSNRLEAAFAHIKRAWKGVYQRWSRKYNQLYLDEYCFRYNNPLSSKTVIEDRIREFFAGVDPRQLRFA